MRKVVLKSTVAAAALATALGATTIGAKAADVLMAVDTVQQTVPPAPRYAADMKIQAMLGNLIEIDDTTLEEFFFGGGFQGQTRVTIPVGPLSVQFETNVGYGLWDNGNDRDLNYAAAVHFGWPSFATMFSVGYNEYWDDWVFVGALEGRVGGDKLAFTGQVGVSNLNGFALYGHGEARFFFGHNASAAINAGITAWDEGGEPTIIGRWGAELETQPFNAPLSLVLTYQGMAYFEPDELEAVYTNVFLAGVRYRFGGASANGAPYWNDWNPFTGVNYATLLDYP